MASTPATIETARPLEELLRRPEVGLAAPYVLKLDLVDEQICWFEDARSVPVYVAL